MDLSGEQSLDLNWDEIQKAPIKGGLFLFINPVPYDALPRDSSEARNIRANLKVA